MSFRFLPVGCLVFAVLIGASVKSAYGQYPVGGNSCAGGYGFQGHSYYGQSGYGNLGMSQYLGGYPGANQFSSGYFAPQTMYMPQPPVGYGGGYPSPSVNLNQSFYRAGNGYSNLAPNYHYHSQDSHPWHLGHYLLGHR